MTPYDHQYVEALAIVSQVGKATTKMLQDRLLIGYNRAEAIIKQMEKEGHIGRRDHSWITGTFR